MEFLSRHKKAFFIFLAIVCLFSALLTLGFQLQPVIFHNTLGYVVAPAQKLTTGIMTWLGQKIDFAVNINETEKENILLKEQVEALTADISRLSRVEAEAERLNQLYALDEKYPDYPKVGARIIAKDVSNWYRSFLIDKGEKDSLAKNMVVLAHGGLVGKILEIGPRYAKVVPLIDDTSSVSAQSIRTEDIGFVKGDLQLASDGLCKMEYIDSTAELIEGDEIVTSNLSEFYPPGLTIGYVKEIRTDQSGLTKFAIIQPVVDFKKLDTVLVINKNFNEDYLDILGPAYKRTGEQ